MKIKKLDAKGFSHDILLVAIVMVVAIGGVGMVVSSHAATCPKTSTKTGCKVVSSPVSSAKKAVASARCSIKGVPSRPKYGQTISPYVAVTNRSHKIGFVPTIAANFSLGNRKQPNLKGGGETLTLGNLLPGKTEKHNLNSYVAEYRSSTVTTGTYKVTSTIPKFSCTAKFTLPAVPKKP